MNDGGRAQAPNPAPDADGDDLGDADDITAREQALLAYLRSMQQVVDAQRDVMLRYLAATSEGAVPEEGPGGMATLAAETAAITAEHGPEGTGGRTGTEDSGATAPEVGRPGVAGIDPDASPGAGAAPGASPAAGAAAATADAAATAGAATEAADPPPVGRAALRTNGHGLNGQAGAQGANGRRPARLQGDELLAIALALVAERTGYPPDMLDPDLDLEADLSIDSIKRVEILGELTDRIGSAGAGVPGASGLDDTSVERLARLRTLRDVVRWLDEHPAFGLCPPIGPGADGGEGRDRDAGGPGQETARPHHAGTHRDGHDHRPESADRGPASTNGHGQEHRPDGAGQQGPGRHHVDSHLRDGHQPADPGPPGAGGRDGAPDDDADLPVRDEPPPIPAGARRFVVETAMLPPALPVASGAGRTLALISDPWVGLDELRTRLERSGANVQVLPVHRGAPNVPLPEPVTALLARVDTVVHLGAADQRAVDARDVFAMLRPAVGGLATTLVAAVAPLIRGTPARASGVPGMMRALARELPDRHVRAVELPPDQPAEVVARLLADEILDPAGPASVAYREGTRLTRRVVKGTALGRETPALPFDPRSVIVVTGGARGITARVALALARVTGCRLELVGRSSVPVDDEDPRTARVSDRGALREVLVELGGPGRTSDEIESACDRILAAREIRATLAAVRAAGSPVTYHSADVRNRAALERVLQDVRSRHGRIDAMVHGAGVLDDRLAHDKDDPTFDQVFSTKVDAAYTLLGQIQNDVRLVVFFGSVSGVFGHRGQVDDCAANNALDDLANRLDGFGGRRIVTVDWGPWAGAPGGHSTGMVSPELEREYARRGIGLLDPDEAARALLAEMATLPGEPAQVVVMRAEPEAFLDHRESSPVALPAPASRQAVGPAGRSGAGRPDPRRLTLEDLTERG